MARPLSERVIQEIGEAGSLYHRLVLVVGAAGAGKTAALREVAKRIGAPLVNVNLELSRSMLDLTERQRPLQVRRLLEGIVAESGSAGPFHADRLVAGYRGAPPFLGTLVPRPPSSFPRKRESRCSGTLVSRPQVRRQDHHESMRAGHKRSQDIHRPDSTEPGHLREPVPQRETVSCGSGVVLLDNIEILFDAALRQHPLRLLQDLSRSRTVAAAWNGSVEGNHVRHAAAGHPEYRRYPLDGVRAVRAEAVA